MENWYPQDAKELNKVLDHYLKLDSKIRNIHGLIVPHAGYFFSGAIAGKAFAFLKDKEKKAIVLGPSHRIAFRGIKVIKKLKTPLGKIKIPDSNFPEITYEHSVDNQIPFLQKLGFKEILPLVVGEISNKKAKQIAEYLSNKKAIYIFSTDLSHFFPYEEAIKRDKKTIKIIENLDLKKFENIDACGKFPLLIMMHLCKLNNWKPKLIEYKNSGDIIKDKTQVVGYASFIF